MTLFRHCFLLKYEDAQSQDLEATIKGGLGATIMDLQLTKNTERDMRHRARKTI